MQIGKMTKYKITRKGSRKTPFPRYSWLPIRNNGGAGIISVFFQFLFCNLQLQSFRDEDTDNRRRAGVARNDAGVS